MTTNQPNDINNKLDKLTALMVNTGEVVLAHDTALTRIDTATAQLVIITTQNSERIEQIIEYLFRERPNGRSRE